MLCSCGLSEKQVHEIALPRLPSVVPSWFIIYVYMLTEVHFHSSCIYESRSPGSVLSYVFFPLCACALSCCAKSLCGDNGRWGDQFRMRGSDEAFCQSPKGIHNPACFLMAVFSTARLPWVCLIIHTLCSLSLFTNRLTVNILTLTLITQLEVNTLYHIVTIFLFLSIRQMLQFSEYRNEQCHFGFHGYD